MTLREEIINTLMSPFRKEHLEKYPLTKQQVEKGIEMKTDAILKLFEKLIDVKIKHYQNKKSHTFMDKLVDDENIKLLEELKEELKK